MALGQHKRRLVGVIDFACLSRGEEFLMEARENRCLCTRVRRRGGGREGEKGWGEIKRMRRTNHFFNLSLADRQGQLCQGQGGQHRRPLGYLRPEDPPSDDPQGLGPGEINHPPSLRIPVCSLWSHDPWPRTPLSKLWPRTPLSKLMRAKMLVSLRPAHDLCPLLCRSTRPSLPRTTPTRLVSLSSWTIKYI